MEGKTLSAAGPRRAWHDSALISGRIVNCLQSDCPPRGYWLKAGTDGRWELKAFTKTLASGTVRFAADRWHTLGLKFDGKNIVAAIDGVEVKSVEDRTYGGGMAGLGSGWNHALFDDFSVQ